MDKGYPHRVTQPDGSVVYLPDDEHPCPDCDAEAWMSEVGDDVLVIEVLHAPGCPNYATRKPNA